MSDLVMYMGDDPGREEAIKSMQPWKMMSFTLGMFIFYQAFIFTIWILLPDSTHIWINRWSWSSADALALSALIITNYVYWRTYNMASPEEANYIKAVFQECREAGVTPKMIGMVMKAQFGERIKRVNRLMEEGKVSEEDIVEALK